MNKPLFILLIIYLCSGLHNLTAQSGNDYIYSFQDTMNLKLLMANRGLTTIVSHSDIDESVRFAPNNLYLVGIGSYFWDFSVKLYLPLPQHWFFDQADQPQTQIFDLQASLFRQNWFFEGAFQQYDNVYPQEKGTPERDTSDGDRLPLFTRRLIVNATYLFSGEQISLKSPFSRNVVQKRNAGSWMLTSGFSSIEARGENSLLPARMHSRLGNDSLVSEMSAVGMELRPGYAYNFGYKRFFMHTSASAGAAFQYKLYKKDGARGSSAGVAPMFDLRAALGYDNGKFFGGISALLNHTQLRLGELRIQQQTRNLQFFVGYRLAEPLWLQKLEPSILKR